MAIDESSDSVGLDEILKQLESKKAQLFVFKGEELLSAWVTTIEFSETCKWLRVMWAGGKDMDRWLHYLESIEQWAKSIGCSRSIVYGRKGWVKKLKDYKQTAVILEKVI